MATILVTGGAGYVGAHCCLALARAGHTPLVFDNLSAGHRRFVKWGPFEHGDIRDRRRLAQVFAAHGPAAVVHCAALIGVAESTAAPAAFHEQNVVGTHAVLDAMRDAGVCALVLSSTCAIYGAPLRLPVDETHPQTPLNQYGETKLLAEQLSLEFAAEQGAVAILRYFNAAGAAPAEGIGERHEPETHAIPLAVFAAMGGADPFQVFGDDYDTRDGTCVRDYVHVLDLADAHVRAVERLLSGGASLTANLGTGHGTTVRELLAAVERVTGRVVPCVRGARRAGDAPALVAESTLARRELNWAPTRALDEIVADAWRWHADVEPTQGG